MNEADSQSTAIPPASPKQLDSAAATFILLVLVLGARMVELVPTCRWNRSRGGRPPRREPKSRPPVLAPGPYGKSSCACSTPARQQQPRRPSHHDYDISTSTVITTIHAQVCRTRSNPTATCPDAKLAAAVQHLGKPPDARVHSSRGTDLRATDFLEDDKKFAP